MMRRIAVVLACVLALAASACASLEGRYFREGIGTNLYRSGLPEATRLQELYLGFICQQAGLPTIVDGDIVLCAYTGMTPPEWALFVQAGMNDIDQRCDAYLAWLDDKRRIREPVLKQLADMGAATAGILQAANAGAVPIAIAGIAFGLAADTFTNVTSRLLLEIDHSTVQAVVLDYQSRFRAKNVRVSIDNRPAAIYLLRAYLRLCMPYSIETSINTTITIYHRDPAGLSMPPLLLRTPVAARLQTAQAFRESIPASPRELLPGAGKTNPPPPNVEPKMEGATDAERSTPESIGKKILTNLCITSPTASFASARDAIAQAKRGDNESRVRQFNNTENKILNAAEVQLFLNATSPLCPVTDGPQTAFEKFAFPDKAAVEGLQEILRACDGTLKVSGKFDLATRTAVSTAKGKINPTRRAGLIDLMTKTLRAESYSAIQDTCR